MLNVSQRSPVLSPMMSPVEEQKEFIPSVPSEIRPIISSSPILIAPSVMNEIDEVNEVVNEKMLDPFAELSTGVNMQTVEEVDFL